MNNKNLSSNYCQDSGKSVKDLSNNNLISKKFSNVFCSECGNQSNLVDNYCGTCGAKKEEIVLRKDVQASIANVISNSNSNSGNQKAIYNKINTKLEVNSKIDIPFILKNLGIVCLVAYIISTAIMAIAYDSLDGFISQLGYFEYIANEFINQVIPPIMTAGIVIWRLISFVPIDIYWDKINLFDLFKFTNLESEEINAILIFLFVFALLIAFLMFMFGIKAVKRNKENALVNISIFSILYALVLAILCKDMFMEAFISVLILSGLSTGLGFTVGKIKNR